ncbi:acetyl-CoA C-acyltransferase [Glaesserella parasuis]|uniref:acetyl-CoA C-acyltransferase n=1 Tax=Glaesserella parasuis TaxID=738 RepID=UPI0004A122CD|nr:acetyl-CoA C-acyltransferase [Glaesserella parasuis]KDD81621.1 acetyl-CoA acetyltransferase [Glaesserella parasuis ST4-2]MDP0332294.1 acetyl-CoA C-acyltransferase [Glaesserella parasuis]MDP0403358.1 acetyl-CoA C-acyltransferase [Glaesserella parasuis]MDP0451286.1 acetyl-CoA C-acyltransferase [Glaesserella parasuis]MDP0468944.1 acetyl-CoA C-acyltransferase [Glaesserella parasuis]
MAKQNLLTAQGERVAIVAGLRTPFVHRDTGFKSSYATDLGTVVTNELLSRAAVGHQHIEQLVFGQVIQQPDIPNPSREIALALNMPYVQAYTLSSSCLSGLQALVNVAGSIISGSISAGIAGGADSISNAPFSISPRVIHKLKAIFNAPTLDDKYRLFREFSWKELKPHGVNLKDYMTQMSVAEISEQMAQQFHISREAQDEYALNSHIKAQNAWKLGVLKDEVMPSFPRPYTDFVVSDSLISSASKVAYYEKFSPLMNKSYATVTEANMPRTVDGAAAVLLMRENKAKELELEPLGYIRSYAIAGNDIWQNMFMGATVASHLALERANVSLSDLDFVDIHETSASQMLVNMKLFASDEFAKKQLNRSACIGEIDPEKLNHLGGSIAFGNPRAATSLRILVQSLKALKRKGGGLSLIASSGLGGLGSAMILESE